MEIEVTGVELALILESLEHRYVYSRAAKRDDVRFQELADKLKANRGEEALIESRPYARSLARITSDSVCRTQFLL